MRFLLSILALAALVGCGPRAEQPSAPTTDRAEVPDRTINPGADIEIVMRSPGEMREMAEDATGLRIGARNLVPYSLGEPGGRGLSRVYLLGSFTQGPMIMALIDELGRAGVLDARRFDPVRK